MSDWTDIGPAGNWPDETLVVTLDFHESELRRAAKERNELREALLDAQPAVELLHELTVEDGASLECKGPDVPNFELCGHGICDRIGCSAWKVDRVAKALANTSREPK